MLLDVLAMVKRRKVQMEVMVMVAAVVVVVKVVVDQVILEN